MPTNANNPIQSAIEQMSLEQLQRIVLNIHDVLFLENACTVNPDKEWDSDTPSFIGEILHQNGLAPDEEYNSSSENQDQSS